MEATLRALAESRGIPFIRDFRSVRLAPESYRDEKMYRLLDRYAAAYGEGLVLYGGLTATERVWGLKRIREITTDLDFVCLPESLHSLLDGERLLYHTEYDILYSVVENVPVTFTIGHIHDWPTCEDFFARTATVALSGAPLRCCSREYAIMLKMRRMEARARRGELPFGKDALDIINILTAPCFRRGIGDVDIEELCGLIISHVTDDRDRLSRILRFVLDYRNHLSDRERGPFMRVFDSFADAIRR